MKKEAMMTTKLCIDCKHYSASAVYPNDTAYSKCSVSGPISLVDGKQPLVFCESARGKLGQCGPDAKLFKSSRTPDFRDGYARSEPSYPETAPDGRPMGTKKEW
jgi:hypothetical protein